MEGITLNTIPAWIPGVVMLYTGLIWLVTRNKIIRMDSRAIAFTLLIWGMLYTISAFVPPEGQRYVELAFRALISRVVIIFICLSQSLPLTVSYLRILRRERNGE